MLRPWNTILSLDFTQEQSVYQQIAEGIIREIKKGRLKPGTALPGSRILAADIGVNRKTVVLAYEALIAEGWLETADKKGTFVSSELPGFKGRQASASQHFEFNQFSVDPLGIPAAANLIAFNDGLPDVRLAPLNDLSKAYKRILQQKARWCMLGYGHQQGDERLRQALAHMLSSKRGLSTIAKDICITRGSQMALYLTAHTLLRPGDYVAVENPGYLPAWQTFTGAGARVIPIGIDDKGLLIEQLEQVCRSKRLKMVYVTPHHQFPTTVSMKVERRLKLLELSNRYGFAIIEDDYDHEYHFDAKSLLPIASHENAANVIYVGSLSKLVAPAVRVGFISGPSAFIASLGQLRALIDRQGDTIMEQAIAEMMEEGIISRHAKKAAKIYEQRRDMMAGYLMQYLGGKADFTTPEGGLAFWVKFRQQINTQTLAAKLLRKGVSVIATERFSFDGTALNALRLGYASLAPAEAEEGIKTIASIL